MNAKRIVTLWGILTLSLSVLVFPACGGSNVAPAPEDDSGVTQESGPEEVVPEESEPEPEPEVFVDCAEEGACETGHECSVNAECGSKKCELTVGLCIESCNAGFTFWTSNGSLAGTCIPTPLPPPPNEAWM